MFSENIRKWRCFENIDVPKISIFPKYRFPENIDFRKITMSRKSRCLENLDVPEISIIFSFEKMINSFEQSISEKMFCRKKRVHRKNGINEKSGRKLESKTILKSLFLVSQKCPIWVHVIVHNRCDVWADKEEVYFLLRSLLVSFEVTNLSIHKT